MQRRTCSTRRAARAQDTTYTADRAGMNRTGAFTASSLLYNVTPKCEVEVFDPDYTNFFLVPVEAIRQLPEPQLNIRRLVRCLHYNRRRPFGCPMGPMCKFVHADCDYATLPSHSVHVNYVWRDESACIYQRLPPGRCFAVYSPGRQSKIEHIASDVLLQTAAFTLTTAIPSSETGTKAGVRSVGWAEINSTGAVSDVRVSELVTTLYHCADFCMNRMCKAGAECRYVHQIYLDPSKKLSFSRAPRRVFTPHVYPSCMDLSDVLDCHLIQEDKTLRFEGLAGEGHNDVSSLLWLRQNSNNNDAAYSGNATGASRNEQQHTDGVLARPEMLPFVPVYYSSFPALLSHHAVPMPLYRKVSNYHHCHYKVHNPSPASYVPTTPYTNGLSHLASYYQHPQYHYPSYLTGYGSMQSMPQFHMLPDSRYSFTAQPASWPNMPYMAGQNYGTGVESMGTELQWTCDTAAMQSEAAMQSYGGEPYMNAGVYPWHPSFYSQQQQADMQTMPGSDERLSTDVSYLPSKEEERVNKEEEDMNRTGALMERQRSDYDTSALIPPTPVSPTAPMSTSDNMPMFPISTQLSSLGALYVRSRMHADRQQLKYCRLSVAIQRSTSSLVHLPRTFAYNSTTTTTASSPLLTTVRVPRTAMEPFMMPSATHIMRDCVTEVTAMPLVSMEAGCEDNVNCCNDPQAASDAVRLAVQDSKKAYYRHDPYNMSSYKMLG